MGGGGPDLRCSTEKVKKRTWRAASGKLPEGGGGERKCGGERAGRCGAEGAVEGPRRRDRRLGTGGPGPRGARGGRQELPASPLTA